MRNIVMENDPTFEGIPEKLRTILETRFLESREYWFGFSDSLKNDPEGASRRLNTIADGDHVIGQTNFHEPDQIEKFVGMMAMFKGEGKHVHFFTVLEEEVYGTLDEAFADYVSREEAFFTPSGSDPKKFKKIMNDILYQVIDYHNIVRVSSDNPFEDIRMTSATVKTSLSSIKQQV